MSPDTPYPVPGFTDDADLRTENARLRAELAAREEDVTGPVSPDATPEPPKEPDTRPLHEQVADEVVVTSGEVDVTVDRTGETVVTPLSSEHYKYPAVTTPRIAPAE